MASSWGNSWGSSWGNSWGTITSTPTPTPVATGAGGVFLAETAPNIKKLLTEQDEIALLIAIMLGTE
jgi:hypothetical protein